MAAELVGICWSRQGETFLADQVFLSHLGEIIEMISRAGTERRPRGPAGHCLPLRNGFCRRFLREVTRRVPRQELPLRSPDGDEERSGRAGDS